MIIVPNGPALWPAINANRLYSYFVVAAFVGVTYDWALTLGQEVELVWRQRWSLVTVLYLSVRYLGIVFAALTMLLNVPTISLTGTQCWIMSAIWNWTGIMAFAMLWIIIITRLYAMYQRSRKILILLIVTLLANAICIGVAAVIITVHASAEEFYLSGTYQCSIGFGGDLPLLTAVIWILSTVWEVFTLCLAVWIAIKHFRELRQHPTGGIIVDCFTVLMKTHVLYFASFVAVSCLQLIVPRLSTDSLDVQIYSGCLRILGVVQMFVLGPRLILGVREFNAKLVADSDAASVMTSIAFQERVHIPTDSSV
ncbi:hypothetical protein BDR06DRAFT_962296 [Suillus hirtellus]|nr:hypothetical protein BDR06DRAFT_962296 [Suillus hirtellus]